MNVFDHLDESNVGVTFQNDGYFILKEGLSKNIATELREAIDLKIDICSHHLACSREEYLSAVSRWVDPSVVTSAVTPQILESLINIAQSFINKPVQLKKMNIICKNAHCAGSIAYHQDITYTLQDPYQFSMWIALNDVSIEMAPLEVIPGSHLQPLKPAVDFWSPHYKPNPSLQLQAAKLVVETGDAIIFDSRLWHGSGENKLLASRYALVTRWVCEGWQYNQPIPALEPHFFGMWTSGKMTEDILSKGLAILFNKSASDFVELLDTWMQIIQERLLPFQTNVGSSIESFKKLKLLHLAHKNHNGGDSTGNVYKTLWYNFLSPLEDYLKIIEIRRSA